MRKNLRAYTNKQMEEMWKYVIDSEYTDIYQESGCGCYNCTRFLKGIERIAVSAGVNFKEGK